MKLVFFIKSATVSLDNYTIKDIPGSSGRLDVISRCILASIYGKLKQFDIIEVWIFLDNYGTFLLSNDLIQDSDFPKNELLLTDLLVKVRRHKSCRIKYRDMEWKDQAMMLEDDLSELLQHECDHLDGILAVARGIDEYSFALKSQRRFLK